MSISIFNVPLLSGLLRLLSRMLLKVLGWKVEGTLPQSRKFVLIAAPHTSNWDAFYMIMVAFSFRVNLRWLGKHTLFKPPFGFLARFAGGLPIERSESHGNVKQAVDILNRSREIVLAVPPEGSRRNVSYWKTGFYYIALGAAVPVVPGYLDYSRKRTGVGPALVPSGNLPEDMERIKAFYQPMVGKYPRETSSVLLREDEPGSPQQGVASDDMAGEKPDQQV